ncbi:Uncharacterised protein [Mycobacteroides abscessus subsp. abscessus]|nr:Uncharacterised protein [Mycobacteroides abscessus subsp. abscessus]SIL91277.1 Uncharacterised protein [Mycobacteroides abscessus subsp. abscessus]
MFCARVMAGFLNAGTPLAIASTPVREEQPAAKALRTRTIPSALTGSTGPSSLPMTATGVECVKPNTITARMQAMNSSVGSISTLADSLMPIRLITVSIANPINVMDNRCGARTGKALARLAAPAARLTATVNT